MSVTPDRLIHL